MKNIIKTWLKSVFSVKKDALAFLPIPTLEKAAQMLHDKGLAVFEAEVIQVLYSTDQTMRFVVLKRKDGLYTYVFEWIVLFDEEILRLISPAENTPPGFWTNPGNSQKSLFGSVQETLREIKEEPLFKRYF